MKNKKQNIWLISPETPLVVRTSFIKMYLRCPAQAMFRYFKGLVILPKSYTTFGTCLHKSAEVQNLFKIKRGTDIKLSVVQDVFNQEFKERKKATQWDKDEDPDHIKDEGIKQCVPLYHTSAKKFIPIYSEESIKVVVQEANLTITGTLDLATKGDLIRDLKTKSRSPNWLDPIKSFQKVVYTLGYRDKFKRQPKGFVLDTLVRSKEPKFSTSELQMVNQSEEKQFKMLATMVAKGVRAGLFYPKKEGNMFCSPTMCGYWGICNRGAWMDMPDKVETFMQNTSKDGTLDADKSKKVKG